MAGVVGHLARTGMLSMDKTAYLAHCREELLQVYRLSRQGKEDTPRWYRLEGFIHAGQTLGIISKQEARETIDAAHNDVFGYSRQARDNKQQQLDSLKASDPDKYYSLPAIERLR